MSFEFFQVVTVAEAARIWRRALREECRPTAAADCALPAAWGRVLAADVQSAEDVPSFDRSTVDGYAVRAADTFGASEAQPAYLALTGDVPMGTLAPDLVGPGTAVRLATGGMLPPGADAAVMLEYTEVLPTGECAVTRPVSPGENVIRRGEDVAAGSTVLPAGRRLRPPDLGLLAGIGVGAVSVHAVPRVAIVSTGDEVVGTDRRPGPGQVRDMNAAALAGMVLEAGGHPLTCGIVRDDLGEMRERFRQALAEAEMLLVSGGSSVGARDFVAQAIADLGRPGVLVHGVQIRPGKPTLLAVADGKPVLGLPGHPASALVVFGVFGRQAVAWLAGDRDEREIRASMRARLTRNLPSSQGREDYVRVALSFEEGSREWRAEPVLGKSGLIRTLVQGDGLVRIPAASEGLAAGEMVDVWLTGGRC